MKIYYPVTPHKRPLRTKAHEPLSGQFFPFPVNRRRIKNIMPFLGRYIIIYNYKFACLLRISRMTVSATLTSRSGPFTWNIQRTSCPLHRGFPSLPVAKPSTTPPARSTSLLLSHMFLTHGRLAS